MTADRGYRAYTLDAGREGARAAFVKRYGREPLEVLHAGTAWLAGPIPGAKPLFDDPPVEVERCGLCGHKLWFVGHTHYCERCGATDGPIDASPDAEPQTTGGAMQAGQLRMFDNGIEREATR